MAGTGLTYTIDDVNELTQTEVYGKTLVDLGKRDDRILVLTADLGRSTKCAHFFDAFPERSINVGIAEQNLLGIAAGLAECGFIPYASTFSAFATMRALEQFRTDIAYNKLPVKVIGSHGGISFGQAGSTHHATEDLAITRAIPNMTVCVPADGIETGRVVEAALDVDGPVYIRLGRGFEPPVYDSLDYPFQIGKAITMRKPDDVQVVVIATGVCVGAAIEASDTLGEYDIGVEVINMHTIKPIDRDAVMEAAEKVMAAGPSLIVTAEEHNVYGGLGGAVAEIIAEEGLPVKVKRLGIPDVWSIIGYPEDLYEYYGIDGDGIAAAIAEELGLLEDEEE